MPQRALLYRRPSEPQTIEIVFDNAVYLVRLRRHRQARRYTLRIQAATREVDPHHSAARHAEGGARRSRRSTAAGSRRGSAGCPRPRRSPTASWCRCAACRTASSIAAARAARSGPKTDARRRAAAVRRRRRAAHRPPHRRFPAPRSQARSGSRQPALRRANLALPSSASRCAISRAAGARARRPACCRFPGGSFWRPATCSTISPRTKWRTSSR